MHVAIVTETWPPEINGVALTVQSLAVGLAQSGHSVELLRPRQPEETPAAMPGIEPVLLPGAALPRYPGLRFGLPARGALQRRWQERRPDAIYIATEGPLGHSALGVARRLGIPACTGFHTRFDDFASHYGLGFLTPAVFRWLRHFHNRSAATLVPTIELVEFLGGHGFGNVCLLRRAVDVDQFDPRHRDEALRAEWGAGPHDPVVLHVGRLAAEKNLGLAVRAFHAIRAHHPTAKFVIVGDGPMRTALAASHPHFHFAGVRRGADLARHYASGDLFLFPSLSETFGNVTLEALASGVPVIAFDYGAAREHLHETCAGRRVPRDDEVAFIEAACTMAAPVAHRLASGECMHLRHVVRAGVAHLAPQRVSAHFAELLQELTTRKAA